MKVLSSIVKQLMSNCAVVQNSRKRGNSNLAPFAVRACAKTRDGSDKCFRSRCHSDKTNNICSSAMSEIMSPTGSIGRRSNLKIAAGAVVCDESILKGDITIGSKTVVHPRASIIAEAGPIVIGEGNIIEEMATIINKAKSGSEHFDGAQTQIIGNYNVFEIDSTCEALRVGDNNILETKAMVSQGAELTNGCVIGAACSVVEPYTITENTIIYGSQCQQREMNDKPYPQVGQLDFLLRVLPNYHHLRKPNTKAIKNETG